MPQLSDAFEVEGFVEQRKELDKLLMSNPQMEKRVQGLIRKVLGEVRKRLGENIPFKHGDPRKAYKAIRTIVYKRVLGGNVNILNKRRAGPLTEYSPTRTLRSGQRGGNRRLRSERTYKLESYSGPDRGFILRFLNSGTADRYISFKYDEAREHVTRGSQGGNLRKYGRTINTGYRGSIAPRNWFGNRSQREMQNAARNLERLIDLLIKQEFNK